MAARIRKGDQVVVVAGKDRSKRGAVLEVDHERSRVRVRGVKMIKRHQRPTAKMGRGGIVEKEAAIDLSNVMLLHKGEPTRVGFREVNGVKVRWSKRHDEAIDG
jgi:large subunit ribosomal protein L24